jgi:signal transduction histidine kinase
VTHMSTQVRFGEILRVLMSGARQASTFLYIRTLKPKSIAEDDQRREFILNVILAASILLVLAGNINIVERLLHGPDFTGVVLLLPAGILAGFVGLLVLSRKGYFVAASYILLLAYFIAITYAVYYWGADLPQAILSYAAIIIVASIVISSRFGILAAGLIIATLLLVTRLQTTGVVMPQLYWKQQLFRMNDGVIFSVTYLFIMLVSWLSNREIEKSLYRARRSEAALEKERDLLELKVEERTRELTEVQLEKVAQLYRFAELGRLSSGLFHDLISPLTALSLNIRNLRQAEPHQIEDSAISIENSIHAARRLETMLMAIRKQLSHHEEKSLFSLNEEVAQVLHLFS